MKPFNLTRVFLPLLLFCFSSCEKPLLSEENEAERKDRTDLCRLTFHVTHYEQIPFDRGTELSRSTSVTDVCTRISFAMFRNGEKIKIVHQSKGNADFGKITVMVPAGTYQVVAIAHSGEGSSTITSPEEISFAKNKLTDTFYYYQSISIGGNESYNFEMKRAVAMFRLITTDAIPNDVKTMRLYYTGGSSTFNAVTGFGSKNSRQTEERSITEIQRTGNARFEVYTFPHAQSGVLKMTISALSASGDALAEHQFAEVPVTLNEITQYKGSFFQGTPSVDTNLFSFFVNERWTQKDYQY